ncbi:major facilitator superfamily domain-containing protein [Catenaria anguillulae PL171]|uniref:Major facilitator superfamily domain-containing protein n=1 Tax=Catenaria anguillulae PL171 TaxID=765915 RepID=A0A1Y2HLN3_9FUNG|nr:major facilitator superfamily domain-containing protein [Catenaria anguillulae PL171]
MNASTTPTPRLSSPAALLNHGRQLDDHDEHLPLLFDSRPVPTQPLANWRRIRSFLTTIVLLTAAGVVYLFSAYATQLRDKLGYTQLQVAALASASNIGMLAAGPFTGLLADLYGPRPVAILSVLTMFLAFSSITYSYYVPAASSFVLCSLYYLILGCGASGIDLASIALNVRSFPTHLRGFAVGVPSSFYGLSAFLFVQVQQAWFVNKENGEGATGRFLVFVCAFLGVCTLVSVLGMWEVPFVEDDHVVADDEELHAHRPLIVDEVSIQVAPRTPQSDVDPVTEVDSGLPQFLTRLRSWLLIVAFFFGCGTGLMVIGNIGAVVLALSPHGSSSADPAIQSAQATQVAVLSVFNCLGRVIAGTGSDRTGQKSRPWWLVASMVTMTTACALVSLLPIVDLALITFSTAIIGYAYGTLWSLSPSIVAEWVDPLKFGGVWGFMTFVPALSQQMTNFVFGALFDAHREAAPAIGGSVLGECRGTGCFAGAYLVTMGMCVVGTICAVFLAVGWSGKRKQ